jgi:hypothetical protein
MITFSFSCAFGLIPPELALKEVPELVKMDINQKPDFSTQIASEEQNIFLFGGWSPILLPENKKCFMLKKMEKIFREKSKSDGNIEEKEPNIRNLTNNYKQEEDSAKPVFDSERVTKQILELLKEKRAVILIGYSEGAVSLFETLIKIIDSSKENELLKELPELLKVYFIDPPLKNFFTHAKDLDSLVLWSIGTTADWVQWISGVSSDAKLSDRKFPFLSDLFLWSFRQFWKSFLVPISQLPIKWRLVFGQDAMFNRALFAKSRACEFEKVLSSLSKEDAELMKKMTTFYLQDWQKEKNGKIFEAVGKIIDLPNNKRLDHLSITTPALENIFS